MIQPLLIDAATLFTAGGLVFDRTIRVDGDRITAIGPRHEFEQMEGIRLGGATTFAVPGFVNAHQHGNPHGWAALGCPDGPLEPWMVDILRAPGVDPYDAARVVAAKQLRGGTTTTVHHHTSFAPTPEAYDAEIRAWLEGYNDAGLRVVFAPEFKDRGDPVHFEDRFFATLPVDLARRAQRLRVQLPPAPLLLEVVSDIRRDIARGTYGAASIMLGPAGPVWCSDELLQLLADTAQHEGIGVTSHVLESPYEKTFGPRAYGGQETIPALDRLGVLNQGLLISHGCQLTRSDAEILAERGASVVSNPGSNLRLHNGTAPVTMLLEAGVNVAIGTDSMSVGDHDQILDELRLMQALQRPMGARERGLSASGLMGIVTANGASALGRSDIGAVTVGGSADLVLVDLDRISAAGAVSDPVSVLIQSAHPEDFSAVISQGRIVVRDGVLVTPPRPAPRVPKPAEFTALIGELMPFVCDYYNAIPLPV